MEKSLVFTYILWLVGGWLGLHHFYLGRDRQAFVWWCTAGGVFGLGWIRDVFRIPEYVEDSNNNPMFMERLTLLMRQCNRPPFSVVRFSGQFIVGWLFGILTRSAVPEDYLEKGSPWRIMLYFVPTAIAIGVYTVGSIGRQKASMKYATIGSYLGMFIYGTNAEGINACAFISAIAQSWRGKQWRRTLKKRRNICSRMFILGLCGALYFSLWGSVLYFNASVTTSDGETVKLRDAVQHFFKSPAWAKTKETLWQLWEQLRLHGFAKMYQEFIKSVDPEGEANAYEVLGVHSQTPEKELSIAYRKLVKKWHPDKHPDPIKKKEAEEKFIEIQQAYQTLSKIHQRRAESNRKQRYQE